MITYPHSPTRTFVYVPRVMWPPACYCANCGCRVAITRKKHGTLVKLMHKEKTVGGNWLSHIHCDEHHCDLPQIREDKK